MITPAGNGWNYISPKNASFGRLFRGNVDVSDSRVRNGSKVHIWDVKLRKNANQQFKFKDMGGGKYKIYINQGGGRKILR
jgi:redox-sensitive bicupin YhaK (pirin superfamily)